MARHTPTMHMARPLTRVKQPGTTTAAYRGADAS